MQAMSTPQSRVFDSFYDQLVTSIQHSVTTVAENACSEFLLTPPQLQQCLQVTLSDYDKADLLLQMIGAKMDVETGVLRRFVDILKRDASLDDLVEDIGERERFQRVWLYLISSYLHRKSLKARGC